MCENTENVLKEIPQKTYQNLIWGSYISAWSTLVFFFVLYEAFYSTRLLYLTFLSKPNGYKSVICAAYDSSDKICISLGCLAIPSIFVGFLAKDMIVGLGTPFWGNAIYVRPENMNMFDAEFISQFYKLLPLIFSLSGISLAFILYEFQSKLLFQIKTSFFFKKVYNFLSKKWFFDKVYNEWIGQFFFKFGYSVSYKIVDRGIFEMLALRNVYGNFKDFFQFK